MLVQTLKTVAVVSVKCAGIWCLVRERARIPEIGRRITQNGLRQIASTYCAWARRGNELIFKKALCTLQTGGMLI